MSARKMTSDNMKLEEAFPKVPHGVDPSGGRVVVQLRSPKRKTSGGIVLPDESKDFEKWNTATGKVIALGPLAYKDRNTGEMWPEGAWCKVGDYVRVPKWGGDRWEMPVPDAKHPDETARFVVYNDREIIGVITTDPSLFKDYV